MRYSSSLRTRTGRMIMVKWYRRSRQLSARRDGCEIRAAGSNWIMEKLCFPSFTIKVILGHHLDLQGRCQGEGEIKTRGLRGMHVQGDQDKGSCIECKTPAGLQPPAGVPPQFQCSSTCLQTSNHLIFDTDQIFQFPNPKRITITNCAHFAQHCTFWTSKNLFN